MTRPLLETKFYVPVARRGLVPRPRLGRAGIATLTLVSAPAGFGKTTLLAGLVTDEPASAWLSLDAGDNNPLAFWTYVVAALQRVAPGVGADAVAQLQTPQPPAIEVVLTMLLNDLAALTSDVMLVLDDFHVIESSEVVQGMAYLLDHVPPRLHVVIASRADPALPLARLRARGELIEVRAADLRFTAAEAADYLNKTMDLQLSASDVAALEERTEGWIAALQLAALSMQGRADIAGFISGFAGDDRYVVDYLVEEVVHRQPEDVQSFLLQTSILDRLTGPLCDVVTERAGGRAMLQALDRANLFLVPLDDHRRWYRYHHLFADVLRARLLDEQPGVVPYLHQRASGWFEQNGERTVAIRHALAAKDFERAADLVETAMPAMRRNRQEVTLRDWLTVLPDTLVRARPVLCVGCVGALLATGEVQGAESLLQAAERLLGVGGTLGDPAGRPAGMVVVDEQEFRRLPAWIDIYRAGLAQMTGDSATTLRHARRALDLVVDGDHLGRGAAAALGGLALWAGGDLAGAQSSYAESLESLQRAGHLSDVMGCSIALADFQIVQGRLTEAMRTYERALRLASEQGEAVLRGAADMYVGMSAIHRERGDLQAATESLLRSQELGEHADLPQNRYRWRVAMSRIREAEGDLGSAVDLLDEAERVYVGDFSPNVRPVPAMRARVWALQGRLQEALGWVHERGLSPADDLTYLREFEHVTLARVLLAQHRAEQAKPLLQEALGLLARLLDAAEVGGRTGTAVEILVLQALSYQRHGGSVAALAALAGALELGEREDYVRTFLDEGPAMVKLLQAAAEKGISAAYVRRLLAGRGDVGRTAPAPEPAAGALIEPLSQREREVLRLLASDLSGPDIARELVVSLNTVRSHTKSIFTKLAVNNRRAAVRRAHELDLLPGSHHHRP